MPQAIKPIVNHPVRKPKTRCAQTASHRDRRVPVNQEHTMNHSILGTAALALAIAAGLAVAQTTAATHHDITARLTAAGYTDVRELEFDDGLWEADVQRADGSRGEVAIDGDGNVLDARSGTPMLDAPALIAALERAGYRDVRDIDRDGAVVDAEATNAAGKRMELRINAFDGSVLHADVEYDD
jgi:hypothetical protein